MTRMGHDRREMTIAQRSVPPRPTAFGRRLRAWRRQRGLSQLDLSLRANVSQRHVSFIETGRSRPRAEVIQRIGDVLDLSLREQNAMLVAAGLGPAYPEMPLAAGPIAPFSSVLGRLLAEHEPFPALVIDRWWDVIAANSAAKRFLPENLDGRANVVDLFLSPGPLRSSIENFSEVAWTFLRRLRAEVSDAGPDPRLEALLERAERVMRGVTPVADGAASDLLVCPRYVVGDQVVRTVSMVARFGSAREITLDELRVELVFPADAAAEQFFQSAASAAMG